MPRRPVEKPSYAWELHKDYNLLWLEGKPGFKIHQFDSLEENLSRTNFHTLLDEGVLKKRLAAGHVKNIARLVETEASRISIEQRKNGTDIEKPWENMFLKEISALMRVLQVT